MSVTLYARSVRHFWPGIDAVLDNFQDLFAFSAGERKTRGADPFGAEAAFLHREFNILNELGVDIEMKQRCEPAINVAGLVPLARASEFPEVLIFGRERDAAAGHPTVDAQDGALKDEVVNAGEYGKTIAKDIADIGDSAGIAGAFLQSDKVLFFGQFREHFGSDVVRITDRIVINHDRQARGFGCRAEVSHGFGRVTAIKHRGHQHATIGTEVLDVAQIAAGFDSA